MLAQLCVVLSLFFACPAMASYTKTLNIQYGVTPEESGDLYLQRGHAGQKFPLVITIHGGGWSGADKSYLNNNFVPAFLNNGYSVFNINYTLAKQGDPNTQWNVQVQEVQAAVRWVRSMAMLGKIAVNPNKIIAEGDSAGGHLALFLGSVDYPLINTTPGPSRAGLYPGVSSKVQAVFSWEGPVDLTTQEGQWLMATPGVWLFDGKPYLGNEGLYKDASPIFYTSAATAPTCIVFGTQDTTVYPAQQVELVTRLQSLGVKVNAISFNGGHELPPNPLGASLIQKGINCLKNFGAK